MTTPKGFDRARLTANLIKLADRANAKINKPDLPEKTRSFAGKLSDIDLRNFVRMTGIACHSADHRRGTTGMESSNLTFIFEAIDKDEAWRLLPLISHHDIVTKSAALCDLSDAIAIMEARGHDPKTDIVKLRAHLLGVTKYEPLVDDNFWLYTMNKPLVQLVDDHPEDVDLIFALRNDRQMMEITEDVLADFKSVTSAVSTGWL